MSKEIREEYYRGPYIVRPDEAAPTALAVLAEAPKHELTDEEKEKIYAFEHQLFDRVLENGATIGEVFRARLEDEAVSPKFYLDYFKQDPEGLELTGELLGIKDPETLTAHELEATVIKLIHGPKTEEKTDWPEIASKSFVFYKEKTAQGMAAAYEDGSLDSLDITPAVAQVCVEPEHVISQIENLRQAKKAIKTQRQLYKGQEDAGPKQAITDIYLGKINSQLAEYLPRLAQIRSQAESIGDDALIQKVESMPTGSYGALLGNEIKRRSLAKRLDYLRNGMGVVEGQAVPWSNALAGLLVQRARSEKEREPAYFTPEEHAKLKAFNLSPEEVISSVSEILDRLGLLTSDPTVSHEAPPSDGKIRVVRNPNKSSFQYHSKSHSYRAGWNPQPLDKVLTVSDIHELEHVAQGLADEALADELSIAAPGVRGKRVGYLEEMGANAAQRYAENYLFGESAEADPVPTYLAALVELENDGNYSSAAKAFYKVKRARFPGGGKLSQAREALDRTARLQRFGVNSSPLGYAEEGVIEGLIRDQKIGEEGQLSGVATCLDLVDQVRLHEYGLMPSGPTIKKDILAVVLEVMDPYIKQPLAAPNKAEEK